MTLKLKGPLKKYGPDTESFDFEISADSCSVRDVLQKLDISASSVSFVQVDGNKINLDATIRGGEVITVNPRVAGG